MSDLWLGASKEQAQFVFLLPNKPILSKESDAVLSHHVDVERLIESQW
ncbi:hypothetical protein [Marinomonas sp. GJ51-6]|nr:hypothetical protein [Marinomonas sp. GJ51-6]WOD07437.1 hypothetical protein ONZ50_18045 [Marinomonas sp. GJ51-6]